MEPPHSYLPCKVLRNASASLASWHSRCLLLSPIWAEKPSALRSWRFGHGTRTATRCNSKSRLYSFPASCSQRRTCQGALQLQKFEHVRWWTHRKHWPYYPRPDRLSEALHFCGCLFPSQPHFAFQNREASAVGSLPDAFRFCEVSTLHYTRLGSSMCGWPNCISSFEVDRSVAGTQIHGMVPSSPHVANLSPLLSSSKKLL